jgi:hypothetical protein
MEGKGRYWKVSHLCCVAVRQLRGCMQVMRALGIQRSLIAGVSTSSSRDAVRGSGGGGRRAGGGLEEDSGQATSLSTSASATTSSITAAAAAADGSEASGSLDVAAIAQSQVGTSHT